MKQSLKIVTLIIIIFLVPVATSLFLDFDWINHSWPRYSIIVFLMIIELAVGLLFLSRYVKALLNEKSN